MWDNYKESVQYTVYYKEKTSGEHKKYSKPLIKRTSIFGKKDVSNNPSITLS